MNLYNKQYSEFKNVFGDKPESILKDYVKEIQTGFPVLDIGAGQGRNSFFLAQNGFEVDSIDPSEISTKIISDYANKNKLKINALNIKFENFNPENKYSAILIFGLIQILDWEKINSLVKKIKKWLTEDGVIFITAFSSLDSSIERYKVNWEKIGPNSFSNKQGEVRTLLKPNEILELFNDFEPIYHHEGLGKKHHHGDNVFERHYMIEAVLRMK